VFRLRFRLIFMIFVTHNVDVSAQNDKVSSVLQTAFCGSAVCTKIMACQMEMWHLNKEILSQSGRLTDYVVPYIRLNVMMIEVWGCAVHLMVQLLTPVVSTAFQECNLTGLSSHLFFSVQWTKLHSHVFKRLLITFIKWK